MNNVDVAKLKIKFAHSFKGATHDLWWARLYRKDNLLRVYLNADHQCCKNIINEKNLAVKNALDEMLHMHALSSCVANYMPGNKNENFFKVLSVYCRPKTQTALFCEKQVTMHMQSENGKIQWQADADESSKLNGGAIDAAQASAI